MRILRGRADRTRPPETDRLLRHFDLPGRLRFASVLIALGDAARARATLAPLEAGAEDEGVRREAVRRLAELDEADGSVLAAADRWEKILAELAKCVMLCANCHREVHAGIRSIGLALPEHATSADTHVA